MHSRVMCIGVESCRQFVRLVSGLASRSAGWMGRFLAHVKRQAPQLVFRHQCAASDFVGKDQLVFCGSKSVDKDGAKSLILVVVETRAKSVDASSFRHDQKVILD